MLGIRHWHRTATSFDKGKDLFEAKETLVSRKLIVLLLLVAGVSIQTYPDDNDLCLCKFVAPRYPVIARQSHISGDVRLRVHFDAQGIPGEINVVEEGNPVLRESAVKAVKQWQFCRLSGVDRDHQMVVTIKFTIGKYATQSWYPTEVSFGPPATVEITAPSAATRMPDEK
jgi:TonB family protein